MDPTNNKCIYVGNLPHEISDQLLLTVFGHFGQCAGCHIMRDFSHQINPYAFIEFADHQAASLAVAGMNNISLWGHQLKVNWASGSQNPAANVNTNIKVDYSKAIQIFVGDIGLDVNEQMLKDAFSQFGSIIDVKVVRYPDGQSKGFAFLSFTNRQDAETAITSMHKTWLHNRTIKCNWATRNGTDEEQFKQYTPRPYELVYKEAPLTNTNVYVAGITENLSEELVRCHFEEFGRIDSVKVFPDKAYAFINYSTHEAAARAISQRHGYKINNNVVKCNWGKENFGFGPAGATPAQPSFSASSVPVSQNDQYQYYQQYYQQYYNNNPQMMEYYKQYYSQYYQQQSENQPQNQ